MLTPAGIYSSGLRPPGRRLRNPARSSMLRFRRPFLPTSVHACTRMRAGARAQAAPAHAVPPHSRPAMQRRPAVGSAAPEPTGTPPRPPNRRDGLHLVRHGLPHVGAHAGGALEPVRRLVREEWLPARISGEAAVLHAEGVELGRPLTTEHFRHVASHPATNTYRLQKSELETAALRRKAACERK